MKKTFTLFFATIMALCSYAQEKNSAIPEDFGTTVVLQGTKTVKIPFTITNTGSNNISHVTYELSSDGEVLKKRQTSISIRPGEKGQITLSIKPETECKKSKMEFTITQVNGKTNTSEKTTATGNVVTILEKPAVTPLVEEFTGTWCGWCPVGFDGMERAHETFGNKASLIAIHYEDPMAVSEFQSLVSRVDGFPSAILDRGSDFYPAANDLKKKIESDINEKIAAGSIEVNAAWASATKNAINIVHKTKFVYSDDNANYAIGYAITEDGMKGSGSNWAQTNNLSKNSGYSSIPFWYNAPSKVTDIEFNHVGVAAWGLENGIEGSVSPEFQAGEEQTFTYKANISGKKLIQNKNKLTVIAILIDRSNGSIVNTAQTTIEDYNPTGINDIESTEMTNNKNKDDEFYDLSGRKVNAPKKGGIYIVNGRKVSIGK